MANNRMVLVCNVCIPKRDDWSYGDKGIFVLAKWYPGESYYSNVPDLEWCKNFWEFCEKHQHLDRASKDYTVGAGQPNPFRLEYESNSPVLTKVEAYERNQF